MTVGHLLLFVLLALGTGAIAHILQTGDVFSWPLGVVLGLDWLVLYTWRRYPDWLDRPLAELNPRNVGSIADLREHLALPADPEPDDAEALPAAHDLGPRLRALDAARAEGAISREVYDRELRQLIGEL